MSISVRRHSTNVVLKFRCNEKNRSWRRKLYNFSLQWEYLVKNNHFY